MANLTKIRTTVAKTTNSEGLQKLFDVLISQGYRVVGPTLKDDAIVIDEINGVQDLPVGVEEEQSPGRYRISENGDALFNYTVGPQSWKKFFFPSHETLAKVDITTKVEIEAIMPEEEKLALIGIRSCDLHAIGILDKVFLEGAYKDPRYAKRRENVLVIGVNCTSPGNLCFCESMGTGPEVKQGYDIRITELQKDLLLEAGSEQGKGLLDLIDFDEAPEELFELKTNMLTAAREKMGRTVADVDWQTILLSNKHHANWDKLAEKCLSCGNCTMVCPTCFCFNVDDVSVLDKSQSERVRTWDSCFNADHSLTHGSPHRKTAKQRYRQWLTHKFGTWHSQFDSSGCVGCGRCIAWCPVGIDVTEELARLQEIESKKLEIPEIVHNYRQHDIDVLIPDTGTIRKITQNTHDTFTLYVEPDFDFKHKDGQFNMIGKPGIGEVPISIAGFENGLIMHTIRDVGKATGALTHAYKGDKVSLRGPFGTAWPLEKAQGKIVTVIAGGIGLAPLRGAIKHMIDNPRKYPVIRLLYGARSPKDAIYLQELYNWEDEHLNFKREVTVDTATHDWKGKIGMVTRWMNREELPEDGIYMMCGPEIMMKFVIGELKAATIPDSNIYLSMERNMKCAAGYCGRCQYGPYFICKDGPVFDYGQVSFSY